MNIDKQEMARVWANRSNPQEMNKLVGYFMEMASQIAGKMRISTYYREDYAQTAALHAYYCVNKYQPAKKSNPFSYFYKVIMLAVLYELRRDKNKRDKSGNVCSWDKLVNSTKDEEFSSKYEEHLIYKEEQEERIIKIGDNIYTHDFIKETIDEAKKLVRSKKLILKDGQIYSQKHDVFIEEKEELRDLMIRHIIDKKNLE